MKNSFHYLIIIGFLFNLLHIKAIFSQVYHSNLNDFVISYNKPIKILDIGEGCYFIDFGKAYFGTIALRILENYSDSVIIHLGEKAIANSVDRNPGGTIRYQKVVLKNIKTDTIIDLKLKADKRNTSPPAILLHPKFGVVMPFRYCEIENFKLPIEKIEIYQKALYYRFDDNATYFNTSNKILNQILELCKHTIKATTFTGYYIDGDRERIPYEADAYINQLSHFCLDTVYSIAQRTIEHFINNTTWPTEWILHTSMLAYHYYIYSGDIKFLDEIYSNLQYKSLIELERADGLITTKSAALNNDLMKKLGFKDTKTKINDIVDWPQVERDGYEMLPVNTVVNSFYYNNLVIMSKIAGILNKIQDSLMYIEKSKVVRDAINSKLFNSQTGLYIDGEGSIHSSLHANMFPLAFGIVPQERVKKVIDFIKTRGMACSVYGAQYLLEALYKYGESDYAFKLITDTLGDRNWYNMIRLGSTMTLEAWDKKYKPNLDWNHAWATAPLNIYVRYMWGIEPSKVAFEEIIFNPQLTELNFAEIKFPTLKGIVYASYKKLHDKIIYEIQLPESMKGKLYITNKCSSIICNGIKIKNANFAKLISGKNIILIKYID